MNVLTQHDLLLPLLSTSILCFYSITRLLYCTAILRHQRRHHLRTVIGRTDTALHRLRMMYITCLSYVCLSSIAPRRHRLSKLTWPTFQQRYFEPCNKSNEAKKRTLRSSGEMCALSRILPECVHNMQCTEFGVLFEPPPAEKLFSFYTPSPQCQEANSSRPPFLCVFFT